MAGMEYLVSMPKGPLRLWMRPIFITSPVAGAPELVEREPRKSVDTITTATTKTVNNNLLRIYNPPFAICKNPIDSTAFCQYKFKNVRNLSGGGAAH
jgi:hypothetical protein